MINPQSSQNSRCQKHKVLEVGGIMLGKGHTGKKPKPNSPPRMSGIRALEPLGLASFGRVAEQSNLPMGMFSALVSSRLRKCKS